MPEPWTTDAPKVLIVADDQDNGELLARLLDRAGWMTDLAFSAASGLSELVEANPSYAAVVLALGHSSESLKVLRTVRETSGIADTRVIICARDGANGGPAWITGTDAYLAHPVPAEDYVAEVAAALNRPDGERDDHRQRQIGLGIPDGLG